MPLPRYDFDEGDDEGEQTYSYSRGESSSSRLSPLPDRSASRFRTTPHRAGKDDTNDTSYTLGADDETSDSGRYSKQRQMSTEPDVDALLAQHDVLSADHSTSISGMSPFEQMSLFWTTQKAAPEILPFPTTVFNTLIHQMEQQQSILDSLLTSTTASEAASLSLEDPDAESLAPVDDNEDEYLRLNLVQVDLERTKWLLKHTLRTRMDLLQKHASFIVSHPQEMTKLTQTEQMFVQQYWTIKADHLTSSVLAFLPEQLGNLDNQESSGDRGSSNMVPEPDLDSPVFVRCLEDCGPVKLPDTETASLTKESVHFLRYRSIRHLVYDWRVILI